MARAAAYAKERDNYTTLFDEKTLEPAIAGPPLVGHWRNWSRPQSSARRSSLILIRPPLGPSSGKATRRWPSVGQRGRRPASLSGDGPSEKGGETSACRFRGVARHNRGLPAFQQLLGTAQRRCRPVRSASRRRRPHGRGPGRKRACRRRVRTSALADRSAVGQPGLCRQSRDDALPPRAGRITQGVGREQRIGNGREAIRRANRGNALAAAISRVAPHARPGRLLGGSGWAVQAAVPASKSRPRH